MKALPTQFDNGRLSNAVATPTCGACCCCCCCLATTITSSSLLAQRIGKEGKKHQVHNRRLLTVFAALFMPISVVLTYSVSSLYGLIICTECTDTVATLVLPPLVITIVIPLLVLWFLYTQVHIEKPLKRAALVTTLITIAFTAEFFSGAVLIFTVVGGIAYLILVPIIVGWISSWYHRHIDKEDMDTKANPPIPPAYPEEQPTESYDERPATEPAKPPQQNPPTPSS